MPSNRNAPARRTPLDGLAPRDFVAGRWPADEMVEPPALAAYPLDADQRKNLMRALDGLRSLILDYEAFVAHSHETHATMARRMGISPSTLRRLRNGEQFPSFRTMAIMRGLVPSKQQRDARRQQTSWPG